MYHQYHERWSRFAPATDEIKKILDDLEESLYEDYLKKSKLDENEEDEEDNSSSVVEYILSRLIGNNKEDENNSSDLSSVCTSVTLCSPLQKKYIIEPLLDPNNPWAKPYALKDQFDGNKLWRRGSFYTFIVYCILAIAIWVAHLIVVAFSTKLESDIINGTNNDCESVFYLTIGNLVGFTLAPFLLLLIRLVLYMQNKLQDIYVGFIECFEIFDFNTCWSNIIISIFPPLTPKNVIENIQNDTIYPTENLSINVNIHKADLESNPSNLRQLTLKSLNLTSPSTYPSTEYSSVINLNLNDSNNQPDNKNNISSEDIKIDHTKESETIHSNIPSTAATTTDSTSISIGISENNQPPLMLKNQSKTINLNLPIPVEAPNYFETLFRIMRQDESDTQNLTEEELRYRKSIEWTVLVLMVLLALDIFCFTIWNLVSPYFLSLDASQNCVYYFFLFLLMNSKELLLIFIDYK